MNQPQLLIFVLLPLVGYLLGSMPFAWIIGKARGIDIRTVGSKNIGATNLGRTLGPKFFWYAFLLDAAKGFVPVLAAALVTQRWGDHRAVPRSPADLPMWAPLLTAAACLVGHLFPVWLKFKGGKGVATGFGVVLGFWPLYTLAGLLAAGVFVVVLMIYRFISLASMSGAVAFACLVAALGAWNNRWVDTYVPLHDRVPLIAAASLYALLIIFRHRTNIRRLLSGTEPTVGQREIDKAKMGREEPGKETRRRGDTEKI